MSGSAWLAWLAETGGRPVPAAVTEALTLGVFAKHDAANVGEVAAFAADWIRSHTCFVGRIANPSNMGGYRSLK